MNEKKNKSLKLNMILNTVKSVLGIIFPLITFPYISNVLGIENVGKYNFASSIISYFVLFSGLGISTYAIREGARIRDNKEKLNLFSNQMFTINIISTLFSYALLFLLIFVSNKIYFYKDILILLSLQIIFRTIGIEWLYSIYEDYFYITVRTIIFQILSLVLMFIFVKNENDLLIYSAITIVSAVGANIFNFYHSKKFIQIKLVRDLGLRNYLKPILILFSVNVAISVYVNSDITILGLICGDYTVGIYAVSVKVYSVVKTILSSILVVSIPRLSSLLGKENDDEYNKTAEEIYKILLSILIPAVFGIIVLREEIVTFIANQSYLQAMSSLFILSIALLFSLGAWFWNNSILIPNKLDGIIFKATFISALVNIVLNFCLIPYFKENAAATTTVIAEMIMFFTCRYYGKKYTKFYSLRTTLVKIIVGVGFMLMYAYFIKYLVISLGLRLILVVLGSVIIYFVVEIVLVNDSIYGIYKTIRDKLNI